MAVQDASGPVTGYEVNLLFLPTARHDPGRFFTHLKRLLAPAADLLLLVLNATPQNRTRNAVPVLIGWNNQWMSDRPGGVTTQMVHLAPADHDWAFRPVLIDERDVLTPEDLAWLVLHELGHVFGATPGDHKLDGSPFDERDPRFWPRLRAGIRAAQSHRR